MNRPGAAAAMSTRHVSRRSFLAGAGAAAALTRIPRARADGGKTLRILCWRGYDNIDAVKVYSAETGYTVRADYLGANDEIFLKLRAGGLGLYDLITPGNGVVSALVGNKLIQPLDETKLSTTAQCLPPFQRPAWSIVNSVFYAAPYIWGTAPMIYASKQIDAPASWTDLLHDDFIGKIVLTNDSISNIMIWNRALGADDPAHVSPAQLNATIQALVRIKREFATTYTSDMNVVAERLASGKAAVSTTGWESIPAFNGYRDAGLAVARPDPGVFSFCDNLCIVSGAPNPDAAYAFIEHMRGSDAQVLMANAMKRGTVNADAVARIDSYARGAYDYAQLDAFLARSPFYGFPPFEISDDSIASYVDWVNAWETVTNAKIGSMKPTTPVAIPAGTPQR